MAIIYDDFIKCFECGHNQFEEKQVLEFKKNVRPRETEEVKLDAYRKRYVYHCAKCGHTLDK